MTRLKFDKSLFTFSTTLRTRFYEADMQGIIHHSVIIKYLEVGRVEYWKQLDTGYREFLDMGLQYVVARVECDYLKPLYFDKLVTIMVRTSRISRTTTTYEYLIYDDTGDCTVYAQTVLACLKTGHNRPYPLPREHLDRIINFEIDGTVENKTVKHKP